MTFIHLHRAGVGAGGGWLALLAWLAWLAGAGGNGDTLVNGTLEGVIQPTIGDLRDLADGDTNSGGLDLGLAVGQGRHNGGGDDLSADNLAIARLARGSAGHQDNLDRLTLSGPGAVVKVVEVSRSALVPDSVATESERAVATCGETRSVDSTRLRGLVELELVIASDVTSATLSIGQDAVLKGGNEDAVAGAFVALL